MKITFSDNLDNLDLG